MRQIEKINDCLCTKKSILYLVVFRRVLAGSGFRCTFVFHFHSEKIEANKISGISFNKTEKYILFSIKKSHCYMTLGCY